MTIVTHPAFDQRIRYIFYSTLSQNLQLVKSNFNPLSALTIDWFLYEGNTGT